MALPMRVLEGRYVYFHEFATATLLLIADSVVHDPGVGGSEHSRPTKPDCFVEFAVDAGGDAFRRDRAELVDGHFGGLCGLCESKQRDIGIVGGVDGGFHHVVDGDSAGADTGAHGFGLQRFRVSETEQPGS